MKLNPKDPTAQFNARDRSEFRAWLESNHATSAGIWLVIFKKESGTPGVSYEEAVEEALCFGWIDSRTLGMDEKRFLQLFSPRKPKSIWAQSNKARVEKLIAEGKMTPAGLEKIEAAKKDGSWTALDDIDNLVIPPDLADALASDPMAQQNFNAFNSSAKKMILGWITRTRNPETRRKRITETVDLAEKNVKAPRPSKKLEETMSRLRS
jgi:uncharacterized protein YdeI (YjbR/CyaY-like superfamily)